GIHRFYLRSMVGFVFIPVFLGVLYTNGVARDVRDDDSRTYAEAQAARTAFETARAPDADASPEDAAAYAEARKAVETRKAAYDEAHGVYEAALTHGRWVAWLLFAMLAVDAVLIPGLVRRRRGEAAAGGRRRAATDASGRHRRRSDDEAAYALHRRDRMGQRQGRRVRRVLGGHRGVRLLLRGAGALRLQLADQLGAREHVPDVRHAIPAVGRLRVPRGPARARRRRLLQAVHARQG